MRSRQPRFANRIALPAALVNAAAREAGLSACSALSTARRELAMPRPLRRSDIVIHAEVLRQMRTAESLARAAR